MRIGINCEPAGAMGGTEVSVAVLADALSSRHNVEIVHHREGLSVDELATFSGANLAGVTSRFVPPSRPSQYESVLPWKRLALARSWQEEVSSPYDVFVTFRHGVPPFCHARRGVVVCMFPTMMPVHRARRPGFTPRDISAYLYSGIEWKRRLASYSSVVAVSEFTRTWIQARWGVQSTMVYPPCTMNAEPVQKDPLILSVGRFSTRGHAKSQFDLAEAFSRMAVNDWSLTLAGSVGNDRGDLEYLGRVQAAASAAVNVRTNLSRDQVSQLYARASVYWHAAGFNNRAGIPDHYEHFGMTTVEAMSAGCVPLVFDAGGQPEIVEHGTSGFVWRTLDELGTLTRRLASDPALLNRMSAAARIRARRFSHEAYVSGMTTLVEAQTETHATALEVQA